MSIRSRRPARRAITAFALFLPLASIFADCYWARAGSASESVPAPPRAGLLRSQAANSPVVLDADGIPVCTATGDQTSARAVPAADGAAIIVWRDNRRGASLSDIYAQSIAADGSVTPGWPEDGVALCESGLAGPPIPVPDGAGGALVLWSDGTSGNGQLLAQRVNADGTLAAGWPTAGKVIISTLVYGLLHAIPDGAGGAFFVVRTRFDVFANWHRSRLGGIDASGTLKAWGGNFGRDISWADVPYARLSPDIDGGVQLLLHNRLDSMQWKIFRVSSAGPTLTTITLPSHFTGCCEPGVMSAASVPDGGGGCLVSWLDDNLLIYMQHYSAAGAPLWPVDTPAPAYQYAAADGEGGAYFIGNRYNVKALKVHRRRGDGSTPPNWTSAGLHLTSFNSLGAVVTSTFGGDLFLCWSENRAGVGFDIRAVAIVPVAEVVRPGWAPSGTPVSTATGDQSAPDAALMSVEQMLVCWQDQRTGAWDIRASRIEIDTTTTTTDVGPEPPVGAGLALGAPWPNPARDRLSVRVQAPGSERAALAVLDITGRRVAEPSVSTGLTAELDIGHLPTGVYWLRLTQGARSAARRFAVMR